LKKSTIIRKTFSICPVCLKKIDAEIVEEKGKIILRKRCNQHGNFSAYHWQSPNIFNWVEKCDWLRNPELDWNERTNDSCSLNCGLERARAGLCSEHASKTVIAVIDVTDKCDLKCPVCFAGAPSNSEVRDPSKKEIFRMLRFLKTLEPAPPVILLSGGEPLVRDDLAEIIKMAHDLKFMIILATNGLRIAENPKLAQDLRQAGLNIVYLQFDGVTNQPYEKLRGTSLLKEKLKVVEICRSVDLEVILVPTLVRGINDAEIGGIIRFAADNADIIRGVVFQPISFNGRNNLSAERNNLVMSHFAEETEKQTHGEISAKDLFPIHVMVPPIRVMSRFMKKPWPLFTTSSHCGISNWVLVSNEPDKTLTPINRLLKFETFISQLNSIADDAERKKIGKIGIYIRLTIAMLRSINWRETQASVSLLTTIKTIFGMHVSPSYASLASIRKRIFLVGCMAFMDQFNFDIERVRKCVIHYITPDLQLVPFCVFNNIYRPKKAKNAKSRRPREITPERAYTSSR
jgi:uncharacterized radical SAM superfamily Fe-S cluster-containing enzyme